MDYIGTDLHRDRIRYGSFITAIYYSKYSCIHYIAIIMYISLYVYIFFIDSLLSFLFLIG